MVQPTVFVVDDDPGALRSLCWLIQQADLPVRAFRSGREFVESYSPQQTGCLVLDVRMPEMDGLEVQQCLRENGSALPVIFITAFGDVPTCARAFKEGALEFLEKPVDHVILLNHIREALARNTEQNRPNEIAARVATFTPSERGVFDLLISGKNLKEIAKIRNVTVQTIWKHRLRILQKMGVQNDLALVRVAAQWADQRHE
jgi:two-component system, LuxR family, response regulator FixJ